MIMMRDLIVENLAEVDERLIADVVKTSALPDKGVLLVVGAANLSGANDGECIPRDLLDLARSPALYDYLEESWNCGVVLSRKCASYAETHPGFFAQVLAHELGHAHVVLTEYDLHVYCSFLDLTIREATGGRITMCHELPHEQAHDAFGMYVAEHVVGRDQLIREIDSLASGGLRQDHQRLKFLTTLAPRCDVSDLREEVRTFAEPYAATLIKAWDAWVQRAEDAEQPSMVQRVPHIRALFE
jgi:hypothetical protein